MKGNDVITESFVGLTAMSRHMLSFGILSWNIPVGWQKQIMVSWWEIWKA